MAELDAEPCGPFEPIIWRRELQAHLDVSSETMRVRIKGGHLPPPDIDMPKRQGWYASTLQAWGFKLVAASASPRTPAASHA